jgi:hypothetical protein
MSWSSTALALVGLLTVTFAPGAAVLAVVGLRGLALAALAPAVSTAVLAAGAAAAGLLGVPWAWPAGLVATAVGAGIALAIRRTLGPPVGLNGPRHGRLPALAAWCAAGVAAVLAAVPMRAGMGGIRSVPQVAGADLHLGMLRIIHATGHGSFLTVLRPPGVGSAVGRPTGWHDLVSLAMSLTDTPATVAANVSALVLAALVVPLGTGLASAALLPAWRWAASLGIVAGTAFVSLPTLVVAGGVLWPYAWGTGLLPAVLGALVLLLRTRSWAGGAVVLASLVGAAAAQRLVLGSFAVLAVPLIGAALLERWRQLNREGARRRISVEVVAVSAAVLVAALLDVVLTWHRPPVLPGTMTGAQAIGEAALDTPLSRLPFGVFTPAWLLGALVLTGVLVAVRDRGLRAWAASWCIAVAIYALSVSAVGASTWRRLLTSWWVNDPIRLAAVVPVAAAPLAVIALYGGAQWLARRRPAPDARRALLYGALGLAVMTVLSLQRADVREQRMHFDYAPAPVATPQP